MMKYNELYEQYYTLVYRLSLLLLKNTQDAEDAAQTIFLKIMEKEPVFSDEDHTRAWLLTVTRNHCRDVQRSFWHKKRTDMEQMPEPAITPFDKQESLLFEIFQALPKKQREVVYLYYFEDYSIKEISNLLNRKESTIQSQLFTARKRMKKQFSASRTAALLLCLVVTLGCGGVAVDAASGGKVQVIGQKVTAAITQFLSAKDVQVANETVTLPIQVYTADLVGIDDDLLILANERGLLVYHRKSAEIAAVLDLQQIDCNYLNADSIATRIFLDDHKLYLFNESIQPKQGESKPSSLPEFAYIFDLSKLEEQNYQNSNAELTFDNSSLLTKTLDTAEIENIYHLWSSYKEEHIKDTFDQFYGAVFLDEESAKYDGTKYSRNSLSWIDKSGNYMLSCLVVDNDYNYELYTKMPDNTLSCEALDLTMKEAPFSESGDENSAAKRFPKFVYTGNDPVLATICAYMTAHDAENYNVYEDIPLAYIPAPVIYGTVPEGEDLMVFCNLWSYTYYRNGNTLECEGGGEAPARLRLHPDPNAAGGYEVIEDLRTVDGSGFTEGIKEFCKGYFGMAERYFGNGDSLRDDIRLELIKMYVNDNHLDFKYYKDYGWDPILIE